MAQIKLVAKPSSTEVSVNQRFNVHFYVEVSGGQVKFDDYMQLPNLDDFHKIGYVSTQNMSFTNGKSLYQIGQQVSLVAEKEGTFKIGKASVEIEGKTYYSEPFTIKVVKKKEGRSANINTGKRIQGAFLAAELSNPQPYINQETILTVKLYARDYSILNRKAGFEAPTFKDFETKTVMIPADNYKQEMVDGKSYISQELVKYILFPKSGKRTTLKPFSVDVLLSNFFGSEKVQLTTKEIVFKPKPLPAGAPASFKGAVGDFKFKTDIDKTTLKSNESVTVDIELIGGGNLTMVNLPELNTPKEIEVYSPKKREVINPKKNGLKGKIVNEYVMVPQYGGNYKIDPIEFTYFNPEEGAYKTIKSETINLKVKGSPPPKPKIETVATTKPVGDSVKLENPKQPEDGKMEPKLSEESNEAVAKSDNENETEVTKTGWFWSVAGGSALLLLLAIVMLEKRHKRKYGNLNTDNVKASIRDKRRELNTTIKEIEEHLSSGDKQTFYKSLEGVLTNAGMYLTDLDQADFTPENAKSILANKQNLALVNQWEQLLLEAKQSQYSPITSEIDLNEKLQQANLVIDDLFKNHY